MGCWGGRTALLATTLLAGLLAPAAPAATPPAAPARLAGTAALTGDSDLSADMRAAFRRSLQQQVDDSLAARAARWQRDFSSAGAYVRSVAPNRERLQRMIGAVDSRVPFEAPELIATVDRPALVAETATHTVHAVRWPVLAGVWAEGLLLSPKGPPRARIVALSDADQIPEQLAGLAPGVAAQSRFAGRLAAAGCEVLIPVLINRSDEHSGNTAILMTNQPHREWIHRQAYEMGRHLIGYEVQKVSAALDWFARRNASGPALPIGVAGYGEGGLLALYAGAIDARIDAVLVSGYFDSRQGIADEPIYRNLFGLLNEFGDAELASLIAPRALVIENSTAPEIAGPPDARPGRRASAAPGRIATPDYARVQAEVERARAFFPAGTAVPPRLALVAGPGGAPVAFGSEPALTAFLGELGVPAAGLARTASVEPAAPPVGEAGRRTRAAEERHRRQFEELVEFNQNLMRRSAAVREKYWSAAVPSSAAEWPAATKRYRDEMWDNLVGRYPLPTLPPNARTRLLSESPRVRVYEVVFDAMPGVFNWGHLVLPKDLRPGERRPVVVCQHGLEGVPADAVNDDPASPAFRLYKGFATQLAERGFVTYAPHNFYRGGNEFRQLQRLAHPVGKTLFALTTIQHAQLLRWLSSLDFVDPKRIGFYGLSYGGNTAMRVPALLEQYAVVIASGDFNEWVFKNVTNDHNHSMIFHNVYEVFEWDLGHTFNHAEMAALIAPRPFMVERGHDDGVARDEWVAAEYAKVRRLYAKLGIPGRTTIEFFNGPHQIHAVGTYEFLHRHLDWPAPPAR